MEQPPLVKQEQYPLLKPEAGNGDSKQTNNATNSFQVTCTKRFWLSKWPECVSLCWMGCILFGISFLIIFALGASTTITKYSRAVYNSNSSNLANNVHIHQIVRRGSYIPFENYSNFLSKMATQYPSLRFNIFLLIDDSTQSMMFSHPTFWKPLIPKKMDEDKRMMQEFQTKYNNVKITRMSLNKYMAVTPLRYKWKNIPQENLPFYARVYSVWQNGGISLDLATYNNLHNSNNLDKRIIEILSRHNNGINNDEYVTTMKNVLSDDVNDISIIYRIVNEIFDATQSFFNMSNPFSTSDVRDNLSNPLVRIHRNKRKMTAGDGNIANSYDPFDKNTENLNDNNKTKTSSIAANKNSVDSENIINIETLKKDAYNITTVAEEKKGVQNHSNEELNSTVEPRMVVVIDYAFWPNHWVQFVPESEYKFEKSVFQKPVPIQKVYDGPILSLNSGGTFISSSVQYHQLLGHMLFGGCQRLPPRFVIKQAVINCKAYLKDESHCDHVYLL